jgi:hypothetical protein
MNLLVHNIVSALFHEIQSSANILRRCGPERIQKFHLGDLAPWPLDPRVVAAEDFN